MNNEIKKYFKDVRIISSFVFIFIAFIGVIARPYVKDDIIPVLVKEKSYYRLDSEVVANAAIIYNIDKDKIIAGKNINELQSIASITKLTSAFVFYQFLHESDEVIISSEDVENQGLGQLPVGSRWNAIDLLKYSLIISSNTGINALARTVEEKTGKSVIDLMNDFAKNNNLVQTHFINPSGLDAHDSLAGSESSVTDLAYLSKIFLETYPELAKNTISQKEIFFSLQGKTFVAENTNILLKTLSEKILLSKTGYTNIAGGSLIMVIEKEGEKIAFVVLDSTRANRFEDMNNLIFIYENKNFSEISDVVN